MMESLENVFPRVAWDRAAGVADCQHNFTPLSVRGDSNQTSRSIVLQRVLQKILHNERGVLFFAGNIQFSWEFFLDLHIDRIRKRAEIIEPFFGKLTEIYRLGFNLEMTSV